MAVGLSSELKDYIQAVMTHLCPLQSIWRHGQDGTII